MAATSLKMLLKNLYSVKCYDKLNMNALTLSLRENFWWGLIYFDQFTLIEHKIDLNCEIQLLTFWFYIISELTSVCIWYVIGCGVSY